MRRGQRINKNFGTMMKQPIVIVPSKWELFVRKELKISERDVSQILNNHDKPFIRIKNWVHSHYRTAFVPEAVLEAFGIEAEAFPDL